MIIWEVFQAVSTQYLLAITFQHLRKLRNRNANIANELLEKEKLKIKSFMFK